MPPRSFNDRDENSMRGECSFDASCEFKQGDLNNALSPSSSSANLNSKRSVTFALTAKVRQVTKITKEQAQNVWFAPDDFLRMKKSFAVTVQHMMDDSLTEVDLESEEFCTRGLEYRTRDGAKKRMRNKYNGMAAVLHEQDRQHFDGEEPDDEQLAKVYKGVNFHCAAEARALGEQDELDTQEYIATDNEPFYDAQPSLPSPRSTKRGGKLTSSGSFHKRSFRGIRRMLSGSSQKLLRRSQVSAVPVQ